MKLEELVERVKREQPDEISVSEIAALEDGPIWVERSGEGSFARIRMELGGVRYERLPDDRNPAQGRTRLLRESNPSRSYLQPDQVARVLSAAGELDGEARQGDSGWRRPLLATRTLRVATSKTDAGVREVNMTPTLQEVLWEYRVRTAHAAPDDYVFPPGGRRDSPANIRTRILAPAIERADTDHEEGEEPISGVTPHSLRRTFISLLLATGADVPYVMAQAGHSDPKTTPGIHARVIASKTDHGATLDGLVGAAEKAHCGITRRIWQSPPPAPRRRKPRRSGAFSRSG